MKQFLLSLAALVTAQFAMAQCNQLFFSEYCEGSQNNKALEIYNPTPNVINLSTFKICRYSNGSMSVSDQLTLSGTIPAYGVVVVTNGQLDSQWVSSGGGYWSLPIDIALYNKGTLHCSGVYPTPMYFNGDDAMTLETTTGTIVDIFGKIGEDPGGAWTNDATAGYTDANGGKWLTANHTLIRKPTVKAGVTTNPSLFNTFAQWDTLPINKWDSLGFHTCQCNPVGLQKIEVTQHKVFFFPNPVTEQQFTVKATAIINRIEIYNILGQPVYASQNPQERGDMKVVVDRITNGVYFVKVIFADNTSTLRKLIFE